MKINVYCSDRGWLFEDLKQLVSSYGAIASEKPLQDCDGYICIRTEEAVLSPKPNKTLVQVHDMREHDLEGYGLISLVHPSQVVNTTTPCFTSPIGSRHIEPHPLPDEPTVGFFCREVGKNRKGSPLFKEAVNLARRSVDFKVLMIGDKLKHIAQIGTYEQRPADVNDYKRVDALFTASQTPMIPLSVYEAMYCGKSIITTPREFTTDYDGILVGQTVEELAEHIITVVKFRKTHYPDKTYLRDEWAKEQIERVKCLTR